MSATTAALMQPNGGSLRRHSQHHQTSQSQPPHQQRSTPKRITPPTLFHNSRLTHRPPVGSTHPSISDNGELSSLPGFVRSSWTTFVRNARNSTSGGAAQSLSASGGSTAVEKQQSAGEGRPGGSTSILLALGTPRSSSSSGSALTGSQTSTALSGGGNATGDGNGPLEVTIDTSRARSTADVVRMCIRELGWREYSNGRKDGEPCDLYWHSVNFGESGELTSGKINKFPGMVEAVRKVNLGRALDQLRSLFPDEYNFHPRSWFLPQQFVEFVRATGGKAASAPSTSAGGESINSGINNRGNRVVSRSELFGTGVDNSGPLQRFQVPGVDRFERKNPWPSNSAASQQNNGNKPVFIVKPDEGSQGEGIYLIQDAREYVTMGDRRHIVQEYVSRPLLIDLFKFDLRVYVVLLSLDPLEVYMSRDGLARFCTVPYEPPTNRNIHSAFMHLTNYSLNKKSRNYIHTESENDGSKRTIRSVLRQMKRMGYNVDEIWREIRTVVVKTLIAISPELKVEYEAEIPSYRQGLSCFQILGFDILLQDDGRPILLEVNANPSLRLDYDREVAPGVTEYVSSPVDEETKKPLVMDTLLLVGPRYKISPRKPMVRSDDGSITTSVKRTPTDNVATSWRNSGVENIDDDDKPQDVEVFRKPPHKGYGSLEKIYPHRSTRDFGEICILNRVADIFLECLGFREAIKMNSTAFRTFVRKCRLTGNGTGFTNSTMDILFIEMSRKWETSTGERFSGLSLRGFVEMFFVVARRRYPTSSLIESVQQLISYCSSAIDDDRRRSSSASSTLSAPMPNSLTTPSAVSRLPLIGSSFRLELRDRGLASAASTDRSDRTKTPSLIRNGSMVATAGTSSLPSVRVSSSSMADPVRQSLVVDDVRIATTTDSTDKTSTSTVTLTPSPVTSAAAVSSAPPTRKTQVGQPHMRPKSDGSKSMPFPSKSLEAFDKGRWSKTTVKAEHKKTLGRRRAGMSMTSGGGTSAMIDEAKE